ncbi:unnamed protein product [Symbiodinium sp. CCMP2592]|nr:unnamed protein product [Symbiodinium sp. CCMP2592]
MTVHIKSKLDMRGRRHMERLPGVDAESFEALTASGGLSFQDAWRRDVVLSLAQVQRQVRTAIHYPEVRVAVLAPGGAVQASDKTVPFTPMPTPLQPILLPDSTACTLSSILQDIHTHTLLNTTTRSRDEVGGSGYLPQTILNTVLLCDNLKDLSCLKEAIDQGMKIVLSQDLSECLRSQLSHWKIPSEVTIYRHRLYLDVCSMLYSRLRVFHPKDLWACHIRADSSPQYGKDYFVTEVDHVNLADVADHTVLSDMAGLIRRRILPLQLIGSRAASAEHKSFRLMLALSADTADTHITLGRTYSIAFDMGTESKLFVSPQPNSLVTPQPGTASAVVHTRSTRQVLPERQTYQPWDLVLPGGIQNKGEADAQEEFESISRMCPRAMPLGDADHAMHHTMLEMKLSFTDWHFFHHCLNAISKFFRTWSRLHRFRATCIDRNPKFASARLRDSFGAMFTTACPTLVEHRWERDVLCWVVPRQEPIRALDTTDLEVSHDLDADEIKFLGMVAGYKFQAS